MPKLTFHLLPTVKRSVVLNPDDMEILITASVGILNVKGTYYLQVITAEYYNHYFVYISKEKALLLSDKEALTIERWSRLPDDAIIIGFRASLN